MTPEEIDKEIDKALDDPNWSVREAAAKNPNVTPEQLFMHKLKFND